MSSPAPGSAWRRDRDDRGVQTLWFDQPGRSLNVLDRATIEELEAHLAEVARDPTIPSLVLRSAKPGGFSAGADLKTILACRTAAEVDDLLRRGLAVLDHLAALTIPTIALIHGVCLGGGLELALSCRWRVALASAAALQVGLPEVQLGLVPAWGGLTRLPRLIGLEDAVHLLLTGRSMGYLQARSLGIVDRLAAEGNASAALDFSGAPPRAVRTMSREAWEHALAGGRAQAEDQPGDHPDAQGRILSLLAIDREQGPEAARQAAIQTFAERAVSDEVREAIVAFFQRGGISRDIDEED